MSALREEMAQGALCAEREQEEHKWPSTMFPPWAIGAALRGHLHCTTLRQENTKYHGIPAGMGLVLIWTELH